MDEIEEETTIELTDIVESAGEEEEVLELTDTVEEEEIIDLTDTAASPDAEEGVKPDETEEADEVQSVELTDIPSISGKVDEELIDLVEEINREAGVYAKEEELPESEKDLLEPDDEIEMPGEDDSEVSLEIENQFAESLDFELDSALEISKEDSSDEQERETRLDHKGVMTVKVKDMRKEGAPIDFKFESRIRPGDTIVKEKEIVPQADSSVSPTQVEKAIERVVREMLSEKIEGLLVEVIEKTVSEEIKKIKEALLKNTKKHGV